MGAAKTSRIWEDQHVPCVPSSHRSHAWTPSASVAPFQCAGLPPGRQRDLSLGRHPRRGGERDPGQASLGAGDLRIGQAPDLPPARGLGHANGRTPRPSTLQRLLRSQRRRIEPRRCRGHHAFGTTRRRHLPASASGHDRSLHLVEPGDAATVTRRRMNRAGTPPANGGPTLTSGWPITER